MLSVLYILLPRSPRHPFAPFLCVYLTCCLLLRTFKRSSRLKASSDLTLAHSYPFILPFIALVDLSALFNPSELLLEIGGRTKFYDCDHSKKHHLWSSASFFSLVLDNNCLSETWLPAFTSPLLPETPVHSCCPHCFAHTLIINKERPKDRQQKSRLTHSSFAAPSLTLCFLSQLKNVYHVMQPNVSF